jgi:hypothetical protein
MWSPGFMLPQPRFDFPSEFALDISEITYEDARPEQPEKTRPFRVLRSVADQFPDSAPHWDLVADDRTASPNAETAGDFADSV